jgi:glycerophosphoryl diester phosphodiesterase
MKDAFDLQGHRGARGLKPENTLPAFEAALDLLVSSLETDLHRTKDGVPVLCHDEALSPRLARRVPGAKVPPPAERPRISGLTLAELRGYVVDQNPDPALFPKQTSDETPVARAFARQRGLHPYAVPALADLFAFVAAYAGELGCAAGKSDEQRARARVVRFNLELKRVPFRPEFIGDSFDGGEPGELEQRVVELIRAAGVANRTMVQCFDHRALKALRRLEPKLSAAVLIANTAPLAIPEIVRAADAQVYSPDFRFLDARQVRQAHDARIRVVPYTVNDPDDMTRLLDWGVDGIITDYPDRLAHLLQTRHITF